MPPQDSIYSGKIIINEIHHSPYGSITKYEFFELYNNSNEEINISGWYFVCGTGSGTENDTNTETGLTDSRMFSMGYTRSRLSSNTWYRRFRWCISKCC